MDKKGVLDFNYHINRKQKRDHRYRLKRRTYEVLYYINQYFNNIKKLKILDIGSADGLMLSEIKNIYSDSISIGIEYSYDLIKAVDDKKISSVCGNGECLPFKGNSFDIVIACAIIEHIPNPDIFIKNILYVLKKGGIVIITTPVPFWENVFTKIGHLDEGQHYKALSLKDLKNIIIKNGMFILAKKKFMISPIGFPFEIFLEKVLNMFKINVFMGNQIIVGKK